MILNDDILNKYIDGDLDTAARKEIQKILSESEAERKKLNSLLRVHNELKNIKEYKVSNDFTFRLMSGISGKFKPRKSDKYFIISVSSFFVLSSLIIIGVVLSFILSTPGSLTTTELSENVLNSLKDFTNLLVQIFSGIGISIFGSIISLAILVSAYFFFESNKRLKEIHNK